MVSVVRPAAPCARSSTEKIGMRVLYTLASTLSPAPLAELCGRFSRARVTSTMYSYSLHYLSTQLARKILPVGDLYLPFVFLEVGEGLAQCHL